MRDAAVAHVTAIHVKILAVGPMPCQRGTSNEPAQGSKAVVPLYQDALIHELGTQYVAQALGHATRAPLTLDLVVVEQAESHVVVGEGDAFECVQEMSVLSGLR